MDLYAENILDRYKNPQFRGTLQGAPYSAIDLNPMCGDEIRIAVKTNDGGIITEARQMGQGCAISQASVDMLMEKIIGMNLSEASSITDKDIYELLGGQIIPGRTKCALLGLNVLKKALNNAAPALPVLDSPFPITFDESNQYYQVINQVIDPELGIGIADMGIIYEVKVVDRVAQITMTLTSMGCPAGPQITADIDEIMRQQPEIDDVAIEIVWAPAWNPDRMKPELKQMLFGY